ncbi:GMC family oxidoreductase [Devosia sp. CN2-171]|uniref:GMC family oxidoreductase n=1 Tax=Devosia sp. CN2-171 TaxID=3400909 RepID=UPI003BF91291
MAVYDYIIVGAGSAGSPLARGLSDDPQNRVLLIEAGPSSDRFWVNTPAGMAMLYFDREVNWNFYTEPMAKLHDRRMYWPRGKMLGGSSSLNGMIFIRGHRNDFDSWARLGNSGWGYDDVLPYFRKMERYEGGDDQYRGSYGPLHITDPVIKQNSSFDFISAATKTGIPFTEDMNGAVHDGVGFIQHNIDKGRRHSAYKAFVEPVLNRPNLTVQTKCEVQRVLFNGRVATGIEIVRDGRRETIHAAREVILSAGSLKSPQILMLSGVGSAAELKQHGIDLVHESPGVGQNLQDHFYIHTGYRSTPDSSYNANLSGLRKYWEGFRYLLTGHSYLALGSSQVAAFVKSRPEEEYADLQISFRPMSFKYFPDGTVAVDRHPGLGVSIYQLRPRTTGTVTLRSANPSDPGRYTPNFLTDADDVRAVIAGIRKVREIMSSEPIASRVTAEEVPGPSLRTDEQLYQYMQATGNSAHHQVGTCKMGSDPMAVVDDRLRVRGVERLRIVDASIMPHLTSGNTNAPTIMIGTKAVDLVLEDRLPRRSIAS